MCWNARIIDILQSLDELTKIFCENDERIYGRLKGVKFIRTGTIGTGAEKCDFCVRVE